jgi:hypothetical protein
MASWEANIMSEEKAQAAFDSFVEWFDKHVN